MNNKEGEYELSFTATSTDKETDFSTLKWSDLVSRIEIKGSNGKVLEVPYDEEREKHYAMWLNSFREEEEREENEAKLTNLLREMKGKRKRKR